MCDEDSTTNVSGESYSLGSSNKRTIDGDKKHQPSVGNDKNKIKTTSKLPRPVNILIRRMMDFADRLIGFTIHNAYEVRDYITQNCGRPASAFISDQAVREYLPTIIDRAEESSFLESNSNADTTTESLASTVFLSDLERADFKLPMVYVHGFHIVTMMGLERVPDEVWDGQHVKHEVVEATVESKRAMLMESFERALQHLTQFCAATQHPPYGKIKDLSVRFYLRKQTRIVPPQLIDSFSHLLSCSTRVTSRNPLNPNANPVEEDDF